MAKQRVNHFVAAKFDHINHVWTGSTIRMVREEKMRDGSVRLIDAILPHGRGFNGGNGPTDWLNMGCGWRPYDEYMAAKHKEEVDAKRQAEADEKKSTSKGKVTANA